MIREPVSARSWENTELWQRLLSHTEHDAREVASVLHTWMPDIEKVLKQGGGSPTDFTLHDEEHAFRVAERMTAVVPIETLNCLCPYELALLLLSAYLHDIGMTPEVRKVSLHYKYLLTADCDGLTELEIAEFQSWLDNDQQGVIPPLCHTAPNASDLRRANRLVAYYCRHRHNDWSEEWIRLHCPKAPSGKARSLGTFDDWIDDLIRLCRSHHFGWDELISKHFNPRLVGNPGQVLHLRYLACALRIADVLEFDPERTPEVVFAHRDISPQSVIFWHKDHGLSPRLEDGRLIVAARPGSAWLYRAVEEMLDQIDHELSLCRTLADQTHFENCPGLHEPLPHRWILTNAVYRDVEPKPNSFVYINSAFRPNTDKLLQIFSGIELYGDRLAAVRELLQNAFDAVREQVAYQRLRDLNPANPALEREIGRHHRVELRLERRADGYWLVCTDTGVGMNKQIIENYLLVSGQARRHTLADLERRCRKAGFSTGRTGQFGIGVLSYFMISDRLYIATRRSAEAKDADPHGWTFETQGIGSWGELRSSPLLDVGSRVELHLKDDVVHDAAQWFRDLSEYLSGCLLRIPCEFQLNSSIAGAQPLSMVPGWTRQDSALDQSIINDIPPHSSLRFRSDALPHYLLPQKLQQDAAERDQHWNEIREKVRKTLRWFHEEGQLGSGLGHYRLHLPYFELPGGTSLVFFDVEQRNDEKLLSHIGKGFTFFPPQNVLLAWKGMAVGGDMTAIPRIAMDFELDFYDDSAASISVSRASISLTEIGVKCIKGVVDRAITLMRDFSHKQSPSSYTSINIRRAGSNLELDSPQWVTSLGDGEQYRARWGHVRFPATDSRVFRYYPLPHKVLWKNKTVLVLPCVAGPSDDDHYDGLGWDDADAVSPCQVVLALHNLYGVRAAPVWTRAVRNIREKNTILLLSTFPPSWKDLIGASFDYQMQPVWNRRHKFVQVISDDAMNWARVKQKRNTDPVDLRAEITNDRAKAAAWILRMIELDAKDIWCGLIERERALLELVWSAAGPLPRSRTAICFLTGSSPVPTLSVVNPMSWNVYRLHTRNDQDQVNRWLPNPGSDWTLVVQKDPQTEPELPTAAMVQKKRILRKSPSSMSKRRTTRIRS